MNTATRWRIGIGSLLALALSWVPAWAQTAMQNAAQSAAQTAARAPDLQPKTLGASVLSTVLFGLLGIVLAIVGFKFFDAVVRFNLEQEICEKQNLAVAILCGFMVLGICIIIAATVLS